MSFIKALLVCQVLLCVGLTMTEGSVIMGPYYDSVRSLLRVPYYLFKGFLRVGAALIVSALRFGANLVESVTMAGVTNQIRIARSLPETGLLGHDGALIDAVLHGA